MPGPGEGSAGPSSSGGASTYPWLVVSRRRAIEFLTNWWRRIAAADLSLHAAAVAYNAFLALVPLTVALFGAAAFVGQSAAALGRVRRALEAVAPAPVAEFVTDLVSEAEARLGGRQGWIIALAVPTALFLGSRAVVALQKALARVEESVEARPAAQLRLAAFALTVAGGLVLAVVSVLLVLGGRLTAFLEGLTGLSALGTLWEWLRVPVSGAGLYLFLLAFYRWGPPRPLEQARWAALVGALGVMAASVGFSLYLAVAPGLGATFATLGAVALALVWLYAGALAILLGAVVTMAVHRLRPGEDRTNPP